MAGHGRGFHRGRGRGSDYYGDGYCGYPYYSSYPYNGFAYPFCE
jgi:hypothetical protein